MCPELCKATRRPMAMVSNVLLILAYGLAAALAAMVAPQALPGLDPRAGLAVGIGLFVVAAVVHEMMARRGAQRELDASLGAMRRTATETAADLDGARREIARLRQDLGSVAATAQQQVQDEMAQVRELLGDLARRLDERRPKGPRLGSSAAPIDAAKVPQRDLVASDEELMAIVRQALDGNRVDLYLQPVVSLPQRKVRFYECFSRLRADDGTVISPERYLPLAAETGLISIIDNMLLFRCVHLIRRIGRRGNGAGFFVNISGHSLADEVFFEQFVDFLDSARELSDSLIFEFTAADVAAGGDAVVERLALLTDMGFRLSVDRVDSLDLDFVALARRKISFLKIDAEILLSPERQKEASIATGDLTSALRRADIDLIVEKVESERTVVDLLDYDVDFGQGFLFGEPRISRTDA